MSKQPPRAFTRAFLAWTAFTASSIFAVDPAAPRETLRPVFREAIATAPGKTITAVIVDYPPAAKSLSHRHGNAFVVGYVLAGAIRSQLDDGPPRVYQAGEHWTEKPGAHHKISENASATEPAELLVVFVADTRHEKLIRWDGR